MSADRCGATDHRFAKFDDATIFCQRCGEQRVMDVQALIAQLPAPIYLPCPHPHYPVYPTWTPLPWYGTTTTNGTVRVSDTVLIDPSVTNVTYTVES